MNSGQKIAAGVIVGVLVVVLVIFLTKSHAPQCELVDSLQTKDLTKLSPVASDDNKNLVKFSGYVKYNDNNNKTKDNEKPKIYLPLDLEKLEVSDGSTKAVVVNDCASLTLTLKKDASKTIVVDSISVQVKKNNVLEELCRVKSTNIIMPDKKFYSCKKDTNYDCVGSDNKVVVATLVAQYWELEVDGDQNRIKEGQFSKVANECT